MAGILKSTCCDSDECPDDPCSECGGSCSTSIHCKQWVVATAFSLPYSRATFLQPTHIDDWRPNMPFHTPTLSGVGLPRYQYAYRQLRLEEGTDTERCCCTAAYADGVNKHEGLNMGGNYDNPAKAGSKRYYEYQYTSFNIFTGGALVVRNWASDVPIWVSGRDNCGGVGSVINRTVAMGDWDYEPQYSNFMSGGLACVFG